MCSVAALMNKLKAYLRHRVAGDCFGAIVVILLFVLMFSQRVWSHSCKSYY